MSPLLSGSAVKPFLERKKADLSDVIVILFVPPFLPPVLSSPSTDGTCTDGRGAAHLRM